jgi:hypothetical protein
MSPSFTVGITMAQLGSLSFGSVEVVDYTAKDKRSAMFLVPQCKGRSIFSATPYGNTELRGKESVVSFQFDEGRRRITFNFAESPRAPAFIGEIELANKRADESIALARPFDEPGQFFYENKIFGMPALGQVKVGGQSYVLPRGGSFAIFDWGRGIWPHRSQWFWGQGAGNVDGRVVAINLGHGYGHDDLGTANAILVDGKLLKLRDVNCEFDPQDRMKPWIFASDDGRLALTFCPTFHQEDKQEALIAASELHKIHGTFSGQLIVDGRTIKLDRMLGFAEHMSQRW